MISTEDLKQLVRLAGSEISEVIEFSEKEAIYREIPTTLNRHVADEFLKKYPKGLYKHQSKAIEAGIGGDSICVATPTSSGKTLIFTSIVVSKMLSDPSIRAIVLYPARALIQDQYKKWKDAVKNTNLVVSIIDGSVNTSLREDLLKQSNIVLMTPDVLHAWFMCRQELPGIRFFSDLLEILVLDEAHAYEGVFGTNMVYLLHRLLSVSSIKQVIASTATVGSPKEYLNRLTGFDFKLFDSEMDGSHVPKKRFAIASLDSRKVSFFCKELLKNFKDGAGGKFLIFAESRKRVEEVVSEASSDNNQKKQAADINEDANDDVEKIDFNSMQVLPYRAGYEDEDRIEIQNAITSGKLNGVVSTSALELGIDIGDINVVIMLGVPASIKSFWQRAGRTARRDEGFILVIDLDNSIEVGRFSDYLKKPPESNWLYLDNEYLKYANVLCAADELQVLGNKVNKKIFDRLPSDFSDLLENEINPTRALPNDLYSMKQQSASSKPHYIFPVRTGIERQYKVVNARMPGRTLGNLTYSQLLNEAFPGAIYRYMAKPYRVYQIKNSSNEIKVNSMKGIGTTTPIKNIAVFPNFTNELFFLAKSEEAFYAETGLQVSERVTGFIERWGGNKVEHVYEPTSNYSQKPLAKYINTSGVCLYVDDEEYSKEKVGKYLSAAFCRVCSIHEREIGYGVFFATKNPLGDKKLSGVAIYDSVSGSLKLTSQFVKNLNSIYDAAIQLAINDGAHNIAGSLSMMSKRFSSCMIDDVNKLKGPALGDEWVKVIKSESKAAFNDGAQHIDEDVFVERYAYTPSGLIYFLKPKIVGVTWQVMGTFIKPIPGISEVEFYNINTGEIKSI